MLEFKILEHVLTVGGVEAGTIYFKPDHGWNFSPSNHLISFTEAELMQISRRLNALSNKES